MVTRIVSTKRLLPNIKQFLLNAGLAVIEADLIGISLLRFEIGQVNDNLIFTSQNGFRSFLENPESEKFKDRAVFCVGSKTKEVVEKAGFKVLAFADYAEGLAEIIINGHAGESFTFFSGSMRSRITTS